MYDFIDLPLETDDLRPRSTPKLPPRAPTTDLPRFDLQNITDESEATSPTYQSEEHDNPPPVGEGKQEKVKEENLTSSIEPQHTDEDADDSIEVEANAVTSEEETPSLSESGASSGNESASCRN